MFEKEAEEYTNKFIKTHKEGDEFIDTYTVTLAKGYEVGFKDGAELGYNKANEWHYLSKGEYPKECENVWCYCKGMGIKFCCVGHTLVGGDNKVRWWANDKGKELCVIAWKEIVPPKEIEQ